MTCSSASGALEEIPVPEAARLLNKSRALVKSQRADRHAGNNKEWIKVR